MTNHIIPRNILYINFASVQTKYNRWRHAQNQEHNNRREGCRHKYRIFTNDHEREFILCKGSIKTKRYSLFNNYIGVRG